MKLVAISDTHNKHNEVKIEKCDILIHSGDWTSMGYQHEVENFAKWLNKQPAEHIIIVPGNHEKMFENSYPLSKFWISDHCPKAHILCHEALEIEGIKFFGSPWTPYFYNWGYNAARNEAEKDLYHKPLIKDIWATIPEDTDILITHGPAYGILDFLPPGQFLGCRALFDRIIEIKPDIHICGHIHYSHGEKQFNGTRFFNAAICDEQYRTTNPITVIEYEQEI